MCSVARLVCLHLAAALTIGFAIFTSRVSLLLWALIVEDRVGGTLIAVGAVFDQGQLRFLKALGLSAAGLLHGTLRRIQILISSPASDLRCFPGGAVCLLLLIGRIDGHRLLPSWDIVVEVPYPALWRGNLSRRPPDSRSSLLGEKVAQQNPPAAQDRFAVGEQQGVEILIEHPAQVLQKPGSYTL